MTERRGLPPSLGVRPGMRGSAPNGVHVDSANEDGCGWMKSNKENILKLRKATAVPTVLF